MNSEDELQRSVESGNVTDDIESKAYQHVFRALKEEPDVTLSPRFADRVVERLKKRESFAREHGWLVFGVICLLGALGYVLSRITLNVNLGFLSGITSYWGFLLFALVFIGLLNWIDKRFIVTPDKQV